MLYFLYGHEGIFGAQAPKHPAVHNTNANMLYELEKSSPALQSDAEPPHPIYSVSHLISIETESYSSFLFPLEHY